MQPTAASIVVKVDFTNTSCSSATSREKRIFAALPPRFSGCCQLAARGPAEALTQRAGQSFVAQLRENADLIERSSHHVREMQVARAEQTQDLLIIERMERIQADGV